jgi:drug/metabolite transporter (DMT)-like permease
MKPNASIQNNLLAIFACLLWASPFVFVKITLEYLPPLTIAGIRFLIAGLIQIPFCRTPLRPFLLLKNHFKTVLYVSFFQTILLYAGFFIAMEMVRGAQAAIIIGSSPLISAIAAHFAMHNDRLTRQTVQSVSLGIIGIVVVSLATKPWEPIGLREFMGMLILLFVSVGSATGNIIVAKKGGALSAIDLNCIQMISGGGVLFLFALLFEGTPSLNLPTRFYGALLWLSFVSAMAFSIWFYLLSRVKVSKLNIWKFLIPLVGSILSWIFLPNEQPDLFTLTGMGLIVLGIIHSQRKSN